MATAFWTHFVVAPDAKRMTVNGTDKDLTEGTVYDTPTDLAAAIEALLKTVQATLEVEWDDDPGLFRVYDTASTGFTITWVRNLRLILGYRAGAHTGAAGNSYTIEGTARPYPWLRFENPPQGVGIGRYWEQSALWSPDNSYIGRLKSGPGEALDVELLLEHADKDDWDQWVEYTAAIRWVTFWMDTSILTAWSTTSWFGARESCAIELSKAVQTTRTSRVQKYYRLDLTLEVLA